MNRHIAANSGCNSDALCPAQFKHTLNILPEKRRFDCKFVWQISIYNALHTLIYTA